MLVAVKLDNLLVVTAAEALGPTEFCACHRFKCESFVEISNFPRLDEFLKTSSFTFRASFKTFRGKLDCVYKRSMCVLHGKGLSILHHRRISRPEHIIWLYPRGEMAL